MLVVMFVSILLFMFISVSNMWVRMVLRILLIPVIAGISYEFIMIAGKSDNPVVGILSKPGLWLQAMTTKEPDADMLQVAIASVEAVFDWKAFLEGEDMSEPAEPIPAAEQAAAEEPAEDAMQAAEGISAEEQPEEPEGFEVVEVDLEDEEDDEILQALDRYFEDPGVPDKGKEQ